MVRTKRWDVEDWEVDEEDEDWDDEDDSDEEDEEDWDSTEDSDWEIDCQEPGRSDSRK